MILADDGGFFGSQPVTWPDTVACGFLVLGVVGIVWAIAKYTDFFNN